MILFWKGFQILSRSFIRKYRNTWQAALNPSSTIFFNTVSTRKIFISLASLPRSKTPELGNIEPDPRLSCGSFDISLHHHFLVVITRSHLHHRYRIANTIEIIITIWSEFEPVHLFQTVNLFPVFLQTNFFLRLTCLLISIKVMMRRGWWWKWGLWRCYPACFFICI